VGRRRAHEPYAADRRHQPQHDQEVSAVADRVLNPFEQQVMRVLRDARDRRWLSADAVSLAVQHDRLKVQGVLCSLCRAELVTRGEHRPMERTYAITTLGEAALDRLDLAAAGARL
jgi:predicted MarR family transcription regulator